MKFRFAIAFLVISVLAAGFALRRALDDGGSTGEPSATAARRSNAAAQIQLLEQRVRDDETDTDSLTQLAAAYVTRARESGDPVFYGLAETAIAQALELEPENVQTVVVAGTLALARHDFERALAFGERARDLNPDVVASYAVITDAQVELGRYEQAVASAQAMVDRRPDFASYSRVSYLRELHGDIGGAIAAMELAARAGAGLGYDEAWARVILGNLHLQQGDIDAAATAYGQANVVLPGDPMVLAALARIDLARGDAASAETRLRAAVQQRPLPAYAIALGDLLWTQGRESEAQEQYALVRATQQLFAVNGVGTDAELALFDADQGTDPAGAYESALAAHARGPSIFAADAVAWAAYRAGRIDDAQAFIAEATRLGTRDARIEYHAGVIAAAAGDPRTAERHLRTAIAMEPAQSPRHAAEARAALQSLIAEAAR